MSRTDCPLPVKNATGKNSWTSKHWVERILHTLEIKQFYEGFCYAVHSATVYMRSCLTQVSGLMIFTFWKLVYICHFFIWVIPISFGVLRSADLLRCRSNLRFCWVLFNVVTPSQNNQLIKRYFLCRKIGI